MIDLKAKPFYLTDAQVAWVRETIAEMSLEEKLGQLFLPLVFDTAEEANARFDRIGLRPGGVLLRSDTAARTRERIAGFQTHARIPMLIAGDLDRGAFNMISDGTQYGHEMLLAASGDPQMAYRGGKIMGEECSAVGTNWNFGPVVDIDFNPFNPMTNVRTFGSDPEKVREFAVAACRGMREGGILPCAKHFPGDGVDGRDQHFLSSVNSLSVEEWDATYGKVYQALIDDGLETIMTVHIMQPAYTRKFSPDTRDEDILPGSLSEELNIRLLREKMGFNGLLVTDASSMAGFTDVLPRSVAIPTAIAHGADIFLFNRDVEEDFDAMKAGYEQGILTEERLTEALERILGLKARLGLPEKKAAGTLIPPESGLAVFRRPESAAFAKEAADRGITLVKDTQGLLPLTPEKQKRLFVIPVKVEPNYHNPEGGYERRFVKDLEDRGFEVHLYDGSAEDNYTIGKSPIREFKKRYDAIIYFMNVASSNSDSAVRISWPGTRVTITMMIHDVPTMMVSIDNPYHLMDAPRIPTYINAYNSSDLVVDTLVEKMVGETPFKGVSPMDPFVKKYFFNTDK
ncbi:MAG: glycoside hydrolase family 3 protein [Clostridia bacterium]|nr:glycoside hydrolase family 3 protein [Clostridia bacterium]